MAKHANRSSSVTDIRSMNFDELSSFRLDLTQDEIINLVSSNIQSNEGVLLEQLRSKQGNDPQKSVEIMKRKEVRKSLSPESTKNQKSVKKRKSDEKAQSIKNASPISSNYESSSEEEKVEEVLHNQICMAKVLLKFAPHINCHTVNDIEDRIKSILRNNQYKIFYNDSIFGVFMKKNNYVVQAQLGRCIISLNTKISSTSDIVILAKGTNLHFSLREFVVVTSLNCLSNKDDFVFDEDLSNKTIDQYFDGARSIHKMELFAVVTCKIWGKENDEDALKFSNLYFIHAFFLSPVDTVIISRLHFDLVESGLYKDYLWGLVAYEELA
ncbi:hypothetical protein BC332_32782 [Capsicum chinense]|nr:hypothetical protein BC332_32782 [Capsicum chinense]